MRSPTKYDCAETYLADMEEFDFFLWEQFAAQAQVQSLGPHRDWPREKFDRVLGHAHRFARKLGAAYQSGDAEGCSLDADGKVRLPSQFAPLWEEFRTLWMTENSEHEPLTGADTSKSILPPLLGQLVYEMFMGANPAFMTYGGFSRPASKILFQAGTQEQKDSFCEKLLRQEWDACFCASETTAGSDVTAIRTIGTQVEGGVYGICGEKRFISAGMHELTSNTLYFVLGRVDTVGQDSFSLSCFIVPKFWPGADGTLGPNNVECLRLEEKMGLNGCANAHLRFGHAGPTRGYLLGDRKNVGLLQLMPLMSEARMSTGLFALGMASSAYHHSLRYARERIQGRPFDRVSDAKAGRVAIIEHLDVQRMLLEMKCKVEGCRGLLGKLSIEDARQLAIREQQDADPKQLDRARRLIQFYVPIVKAYVSDQAWRICELAIQVHGGVGYTKDTPVEQYARDVKVLSIWEGTNYIQSQDLLRDKLAFGRDSRTITYFREDVEAFLDGESQSHFPGECGQLRTALSCCVQSLEVLSGIVKSGDMTSVSQFSTRLLEMFAETCVAWVLLEAAVAARRALATQAGQSRAAFYQGKIDSAKFFIYNILPGVRAKADIIRDFDKSLVVMPSANFGYLQPA